MAGDARVDTLQTQIVVTILTNATVIMFIRNRSTAMVTVDTKHPSRRLMRDNWNVKTEVPVAWLLRGSVSFWRLHRPVARVLGLIVVGVIRVIRSRRQVSLSTGFVLSLRQWLAQDCFKVAIPGWAIVLGGRLRGLL